VKYRVTHTTRYQYSQPVSVCHNKVHLCPRSLPSQETTNYRLLITPEPAETIEQHDYFGNRVDYFAIQEPHRILIITAISQIEVRPVHRPPDFTSSPAWETIAQTIAARRDDLNLSAFQFSFPSRLSPREEKYAAYARESFTKNRPIVEACSDLTSRIFEDFKYDPRATTVSTPVDVVFDQRAGVCQDFAHLQIACLRSIGLAARYVSGYLRTIPPPGKERLIGNDASHAWLSLFCGDTIGWVDYDPTNNIIPSTDHITIGWGQDYSDLCPIQGVFVGGGKNTMDVQVDVAIVE
jgi:transglutaminase-like putative cysteine protease